ncbi:MAG: hypothetical protein HOP27_01970 [Anaerolineales bacterium]|nr:hypothetical protein [Anaerolineales bacterium]
MKPPLLLVIAASSVTMLSLYNLYRFWFDIDNHHKRNQNRIKNLHPKYPFRSYAENLIKNKKAWAFQGRALGTFNTLILLAVDCLLIYAFIFGQ